MKTTPATVSQSSGGKPCTYRKHRVKQHHYIRHTPLAEAFCLETLTFFFCLLFKARVSLGYAASQRSTGLQLRKHLSKDSDSNDVE
jgi:hypothetical protein